MAVKILLLLYSHVSKFVQPLLILFFCVKYNKNHIIASDLNIRLIQPQTSNNIQYNNFFHHAIISVTQIK